MQGTDSATVSGNPRAPRNSEAVLNDPTPAKAKRLPGNGGSGAASGSPTKNGGKGRERGGGERNRAERGGEGRGCGNVTFDV